MLAPEFIAGVTKKDSLDTVPVVASRMFQERLEASKSAHGILGVLDSIAWFSEGDLKRDSDTYDSYLAKLNQWKSEGKLFSVEYQGEECYPLRAFNKQGVPVPALADLIGLFRGKRSAVYMLNWLVAPNSWLGAVAPIDCLEDTPNAVIDAAKMDIKPSEHG